MSGSYTSREGYNLQITAPSARGPDPRAASQVANAVANGMAEISGRWAQTWAAAEQADQVHQATKLTADASMQLADMQLRYEQDADPATVPARFKDEATSWAAGLQEGLPPGLAARVGSSLAGLTADAYRRTVGSAFRRHTETLRTGMATTLGTHAQALAGARDEPDVLTQLAGMKRTIAGNVASGVVAEAAAGPLFSNAARQAITIKAASDPIAAQALLDRLKGEMEAGDVAALVTGLRAPVERRLGEEAAAASIAASGGAAGIVDAIMAQESGGRDGLVSVDGARGRMQIMPGTWAQYARPGEAIDNPEHNRAVGERIVADLARRFGDDPARIAVGYFSGPGNVAPPVSPAPWKEDRRDGNGMSVSRYVAQVTARLAPAGTTASQRDAAMADVRARLADAPLHVRLSSESQVAQHFSRTEGEQEQAKAILGRELSDLSAAYQGGQTATEIPESRIRALLPPNQAQRTVDSLAIARSAGDAVRAVAYASPAQAADMRARLAGDETDPYLAGQRQAAVAAFDAGMKARRTALAADPAAYVAELPAIQRLAEARTAGSVAGGADTEGGPAATRQHAVLLAQEQLGVPPSQRRMLRNDQVASISATLRTTGPETADMGATLAGIAEQFGPALWSRAFGELVQHGKIGWEWQAVAAMSHPGQAEGRALLQRALVFAEQKGGREAVRKLVAPDTMKGFDVEVAGALADFAEATRHHPGGDSLFDTTRRAVDLLATYYAWRGASASDATQRAYQDVIGARWDTAGDDGANTFGNTPTMLVPKGQAGPIERALDRTRAAIQPGDLLPLADPTTASATEAQRRAATLSAARRGFWINNADASGAVLKGRSPGGSVIDILRADGSPIEVRFNALPTEDRDGAEQLELEQSRDAARALRDRSR